MKNKRYFNFKFLFILLCFAFLGFYEEGMFPLSEISTLNLKQAGLKIETKDIFNPKGTSLINALVDVGGCTGSFISSEGLVLTNHHCVFSAVQSVSTTQNNYITDGFLAKNRDEEIPAKGMYCKIIQSYEDVSEEIVKELNKHDDFLERNQALSKITKEIIQRTEKKDSTIKAEISEMFIGKTYILFKYKILRDIRLVYVPPRNIGEFGGEEDNWVWPRHNGDFSIARAYVGPDGNPASYNKSNIPFKPEKYLKINKNGISEDDFVFILGYPGRTYRHFPSEFLKYHQDILLPYISNLYQWQISEMEKLSNQNKENEIKYAARIKSLSNVEKNYRGKLQGFSRIGLIGKKVEEEMALANFIKSNPDLSKKYGKTINDLNSQYHELYLEGKRNLILQNINRNSSLIYLYNQLYDYFTEIKKDESLRKENYLPKNIDKTKNQIKDLTKSINHDLEKIFLSRLFNDAKLLENNYTITAIDNLQNTSTDEFLNSIFNKEKYSNIDFVTKLIDSEKNPFENSTDKFYNFIVDSKKQQDQIDIKNQERQGAINKYFADLLEVKKIWQKRNFIPDANSTLRLTYGYVKGYSPADAIYYSPFTTLKGMVEKSHNKGVYTINDKILNLLKDKNLGAYLNKKFNDITVAFLYNMDTTGGNSGSPVMNAKGELIGLNFDRTFEATINDYAWNQSYSRSIGVDIRFILFVLDKVSNAQNIIKELQL